MLIRVLVKSYLSYGGQNKKYATNYDLASKEQPDLAKFEKVRTKLIENIKRYERNLKISGRVTKAGAEKYDKHLQDCSKKLKDAKTEMNLYSFLKPKKKGIPHNEKVRDPPVLIFC